jgi:hypothetical protein
VGEKKRHSILLVVNLEYIFGTTVHFILKKKPVWRRKGQNMSLMASLKFLGQP